jgi:hypothetical protein
MLPVRIPDQRDHPFRLIVTDSGSIPGISGHVAGNPDHKQIARACGLSKGVIVSDEHGAYDILIRNYPRIQAHGGCLAHARRKFADAAKGRKDTSDAHEELKRIALIYAQERKTAHLSGAQRIEARQQLVAPHMQRLKTFLDEIVGRYINKGAMKTAIGLSGLLLFAAFSVVANNSQEGI